jgi:hypothetical protein
MDARSQKALLWTFLVFSQIYTWSFVYLLGFWPPVSAALTAAQVLELYSRHNMEFRAGVALMMVSGAFYLPFTVVIAAQMARCESGFAIWSKMQLSSGVLGTWVFGFPPFLWGVAAFSVDRDPGLTLLMHEFGWLCFVTPPTYFALQLIPIAVVSLSGGGTSNSAFPRWIGFLTIWTALSASSGVMAMLFKTGPFAWNGLISFYMPLTVFTTWLISISVTMIRAINGQARVAQAAAALETKAARQYAPPNSIPWDKGASHSR